MEKYIIKSDECGYFMSYVSFGYRTVDKWSKDVCAIFDKEEALKVANDLKSRGIEIKVSKVTFEEVELT